MRFDIHVVPNSKKNLVISENNKIKIYVNKPTIDNKANEKTIELLAEFLKLKKRDIKIIKGQKSRNKIIEICKN